MKNYKKLAITDVYPKVESFQQISLVENFIFWVGEISSEINTRNTIFVRPFLQKNLEAQNLIGDNFYVKSNFHGYGGKSYKCFFHKDKFYLIWIDQITNSLWFKIFEINSNGAQNGHYLVNLTSSPFDFVGLRFFSIRSLLFSISSFAASIIFAEDL